MVKRPSKKEQQRVNQDVRAALGRRRTSVRYRVVGGDGWWQVWDNAASRYVAGPFETERRAKLAVNQLKRSAT
jgi:hypothetical protein